MQKVILLKGLPASGKSTYAKDFVQKNTNFIRVNKDDLRSMLHADIFFKDKEKFILKVRDTIIINALYDGKSVIVDDTNLNKVHEETIRKIVDDFNLRLLICFPKVVFEIDEQFLKIPLEECIERDSKRGSKSVGAKVIKDMYRRYIKPVAPIIPYNPNLRDCIMCDLDGTLALINGRNPYDGKSCASDIVNEPVKEILYEMGESKMCYDIIITSARNDNSRDETMTWLYQNDIKYNQLIMRKDGDVRSDDIVKKEMYENLIKPFYNVRFVLDDRDKVVKLWRSLGLTCLQVAEGDF